MRADRETGLRRGAEAFCALALWSLLSIACVRAASAEPIQIRLLPGIAERGAVAFPLRVERAGSAVIALFPADTLSAELIVNGKPIERAESAEPLGSVPFGHGAASLVLSGLVPGDRAELRLTGSGGTPLIVRDVAAPTTAFGLGLAGGAYYGILLAVVVFQLVSLAAMPDRTIVWYVAWLLSFIGITCCLDGFIASPAAAALWLLVFHVSAGISLIGFGATFLRLYSGARKLFVALVGFNVFAVAAPVAIALATHAAPTNFTMIGSALASVSAITIVALIRRRNGFAPASFLALGLLGIVVVFAARIASEAVGVPSPFLERWGIQIASVFDSLLFSLGLAYRSRYELRERRAIQVALTEASYEAGHDVLTGLLNRRGLDEAYAALEFRAGTILFIDLDGFKSVNDTGGHSAGDAALVSVARMMRLTVRESDVVARVGGDEFVVLLLGCRDAAFVTEIVARMESSVGFMRPLGSQSEMRIGLSIGVALFSEDRAFADTLREADLDAYRIKRQHYAERKKAGNPYPERRGFSLPGSAGTDARFA